MFKRTIQLTAICLGLLLAGGLSQSQAQVKQERIGYVNPQAILQKMPEMKAVQQRLQNFVEQKQKELGQQQQELQQKIADYQKRQSVISEDAKKKEEEQLGQIQADVQQAQREAEQEVQQKQQELVGPLREEIDKSISAVAEEMNLSYVMNTITTNGDFIILYASDEAQEKYDITEQVMEKLGIGS
jgi:outer membrane protein